MSDLVAYLYTGTASNLQALAKDLLNAANKYELPRLFAMCEKELVLNIKVADVADMLILADLHSSRNLKKACLKFIHLNSEEVYATESWKHLKDNVGEYSSLLFEVMEYRPTKQPRLQ